MAFVAAGLFPPWFYEDSNRNRGYHFILSYPPKLSSPTVDFRRLGVEWAIIAVVTGALLLSFASRKKKTPDQPDV